MTVLLWYAATEGRRKQTFILAGRGSVTVLAIHFFRYICKLLPGATAGSSGSRAIWRLWYDTEACAERRAIMTMSLCVPDSARSVFP